MFDWGMWVRYAPRLMNAILTHFYFVIVSVTIGSVIAVILAIALSRFKKAAKYLMPILGIFQTIPGIVFIGVLFIYIGMRPETVIIALSVYAILPVLKNAYTGIVTVDPALIEAGRGIGMNPWILLWRVELPMALNSIITGIRMSTIYTVSWAVLAAMIGQGGLGEFIYIGINSNMKQFIVMGSIPAALMAIGLGYLIDKVQVKLTPRGLRRN
jgi:osmoprotectant transport system permease protein